MLLCPFSTAAYVFLLPAQTLMQGLQLKIFEGRIRGKVQRRTQTETEAGDAIRLS